MCKIKNYAVSSFLVPLKGNGQSENFRVSISPMLVVNMLSFDVVCCVLWCFNVLDGNWQAEECLASCRVTKAEFH